MLDKIPFGFFVTVNATGQLGQVNMLRREGDDWIHGVRDLAGNYIGSFKVNEISANPTWQFEERRRDIEEGMF